MKLLQSLLALREQADQQFEITTDTDRSKLSKLWPDGVLYKGNNVFKIVYEDQDSVLADAMTAVKDDFEENDSLNRLDMQESYLGYSKSKDLFIQGYDGWATEASDIGSYGSDDDDDSSEDDTEDYNCSPYVTFKITDDGKIKVESKGMDYGNNRQIWYAKNGGHKVAKESYSDLLDIRLD